MPAYSAGALGDDAAWKPEDRSLVSPSSNGKLRAAATVAEARWKAISNSGDPLSGPALTASGVAVDSVPVEQMQLLSLKLTDAQASNQRKDALIGTLEQQVADLTRALSLHATARQEWAASEVARENALHAAEEEGRRLAHELDVERGEHVQTKHLLKLTVERQEAKWRTVRSEVERSEAERVEAERTALQLRTELEQMRQAVAETQKQHRVFEAQVRALSQQNEELHEKRRAEKSDLAYLAKEHQNLQQQLQLQAQELEAAQKAAATQSQCWQFPHAWSHQQLRRDFLARLIDPAPLRLHVFACVCVESLADRLTAELESQRTELSTLRTAAIAAETQCSAHVSLLRQGEEQCGKMETRIASQEELIRQLQATVSERESEEVALAATKKQLVGALADLESAKNQVKALQSQLASTMQALNQSEQQTVPALQRQLNSLELHEKKLRGEVEARGRAFKMHVEQMQQVVQKNPFNARLSASTAPTSSSSAASLAVEDLVPAASSTSSSTNAADGESFSQLREQFNAQLLELTSRTRAAHNLLLDAERTTKHAQDDLADARRQSAQLQREMAEAAAESGERLRAVEQQYMEVSAQLLAARNEVQESQTISDAHHAHLRTVWESCQLLHRAFRPLLARFRDVVQQKNFLSRELFAYHAGVAREVHELRVAMTVREGGDGAAVAAATTALAPLHPYRVHAPRLSLRSVAIAVLAARRIWTGSTVAGQQYGVMLHTGTADPVPLLASSPFELTNSLSRQSSDEAQARRERELALPSVDTTTLPAAASSLVKLLNHFDCSAALAMAARPRLSSPSPHGHSLLQQLAASSAAFRSSRSSRVSRPARSSGPREDVVKIREVVLFLSSCIKELELQVLTGQQDYVSLIAASTATEEKLQAEQKRAHQMMREAVEEARDNELAATLRMKETELRLGACEAQKADMIDKEEYARLQEENLRKCSELEQLNKQLQAQRTTLQQQVHQVRKGVCNRWCLIVHCWVCQLCAICSFYIAWYDACSQAGVDLRERDSIIQSLKKLAEEKQQAVNERK
jgi:myosin heavy subunit